MWERKRFIDGMRDWKVGLIPCITIYRGFKLRKLKFEFMADGVIKLMENLNFSEDELMEVGAIEGELMGNIAVDMGQQGASKKKLGIVYKHPRHGTGALEGGHSSNEERSVDRGLGVVQRDKGKQAGTRGLRFWNAKRTLQGKNEVCNPISSKRTKQSASCRGCEEDESGEIRFAWLAKEKEKGGTTNEKRSEGEGGVPHGPTYIRDKLEGTE
ncbi:hypothetical protein V6N13_142420 [Hibiscus sabdariffa]